MKREQKRRRGADYYFQRKIPRLSAKSLGRKLTTAAGLWSSDEKRVCAPTAAPWTVIEVSKWMAAERNENELFRNCGRWWSVPESIPTLDALLQWMAWARSTRMRETWMPCTRRHKSNYNMRRELLTGFVMCIMHHHHNFLAFQSVVRWTTTTTTEREREKEGERRRHARADKTIVDETN
jgi:hypothetical protein